MNQDYWIKRWNLGKVGFNQANVNARLQKYLPDLQLAEGDAVFVPLCGKTIDMHFLQEKLHVIGVECAEKAVQEFFIETNQSAIITENEPFRIYSAEHIDLWCGDFFKLRPRDFKKVKAVFDRASLVAFPSDMRKRYAQHLNHLLQPGTKILLITVVYPSGEMEGPPFSVSEHEVKHLFSENFKINRVLQRDVLADNKKFADRGLSALKEEVYLMSKEK